MWCCILLLNCSAISFKLRRQANCMVNRSSIYYFVTEKNFGTLTLWLSHSRLSFHFFLLLSSFFIFCSYFNVAHVLTNEILSGNNMEVPYSSKYIVYTYFMYYRCIITMYGRVYVFIFRIAILSYNNSFVCRFALVSFS